MSVKVLLNIRVNISKCVCVCACALMMKWSGWREKKVNCEAINKDSLKFSWDHLNIRNNLPILLAFTLENLLLTISIKFYIFFCFVLQLNNDFSQTVKQIRWKGETSWLNRDIQIEVTGRVTSPGRLNSVLSRMRDEKPRCHSPIWEQLGRVSMRSLGKIFVQVSIYKSGEGSKYLLLLKLRGR